MIIQRETKEYAAETRAEEELEKLRERERERDWRSCNTAAGFKP